MLRIDVLLVLVSGAFVLAPQAIGGPGPRPSQGEQREADPQHCPSRSSDEVPEGLAASDWSSIRAAYEANRHAAFAVEGGYQARNPGQGWWTRFDSRGFLVQPDAGGWEWGLQLERYGFAGEERSVTEPKRMSAECQRVAYAWDETLEEWYLNDTRGLEHGYTVHERPTQSAQSEPGPLTFTLAVRGELRPEVTADGRSVRFANGLGVSVLTYTGLTVLDADGKELPAGFERAAEGLWLWIDERAARYPLTIDPIAQQAYLKASNTQANDQFGFAVGVSGDTVVVGALGEDSNANSVNGDQSNNSSQESGAAYVFVRNGASWSQEAYLKGSHNSPFDYFGQAVAISGDTVVVGAPFDDPSIEDSGAAYVFVRSGTSWSQEARLESGCCANSGDHLGFSVAISGDTIVAGVPDALAPGTGKGEVRVFVRSGTTWGEQAFLADATPEQDGFGRSVAVSDDTVVVGAPGEDSNATGVNGDPSNNGAQESGAAYVFVRNGTSWSQEAYLKASNTETFDGFGGSVSVSGNTVVVGAPGEDSNATGVNGDQSNNAAETSGAVYVFVRIGTSWSQQAYLKASNAESFDGFGGSVSASGDRAVVGAALERSNATGVNGNQANNSFASCCSLEAPGAAYVFVRSGASWTQEAYLKASNTEPGPSGSLFDGDRFGFRVAVSNDTVVVATPLEDSNAIGVNGDQESDGAPDAGAVYVFDTCSPCAVAFRNGGANPVSYFASPIVIGSTFTATVENTLAAQLTSILFAFDTPFSITLGGGQTLLCLDLGGSGEAFTGAGLLPSSSLGGVDRFSFPFPTDPSALGVVFYSQAIQFGNPPFVLSNAQDLTIGSF